MAKYPIAENPVYTEDIEQLARTDPASAEVFNAQFLAVHDNVKAVKQAADAARGTADAAVPVTRTINGKALSEDVVLTPGDVGADAAGAAASVKAELVPDIQEVNSRSIENSAAVAALQDALFSNITGNPFTVTFGDLDGITLTKGVWNTAKQRIEC